MSLFIAEMQFALMSLLTMAIAVFIAWRAAKGFPKTWDRHTFVLAFPGFCLWVEEEAT
jgi:hypothetical protein